MMAKSGLFFVARSVLGANTLYESDGTAAGTREVTLLPAGNVTALQSLGNGLALFQLNGTDIGVTGSAATGARPLATGSQVEVIRPGLAVFREASADRGLGITDGVTITSATPAGTPITGGGVSGTITILGTNTDQGDGSATFAMNRQISPPRQSDYQVGSSNAFVPAAAPGGFSTWFTPSVFANRFLVTPAQFEALPTHLSTAGTRWIPDWLGSTEYYGTLRGLVRLDGDRAVVSFQPDVVTGGNVEPWVVSQSGITLLREINPSAGSEPQGLAHVGAGRVAFTADAGGGLGRELWITNGTSAGTIALGDLRPGAAGSDAAGFTATTGGRFVFSADDGVAGREVWVSDGTAAGTRLLVDLLPGAGGSNPQNFTALADGRVAFTGTGAGGTGLWATDGTAAGTVAFGAGLVASNLAATTIFDGVNSTITAVLSFGVPMTVPIVGTARDDALRGSSVNDTFIWSAGDDVLDGGLGTDTAHYRDFNARAWNTSYTAVDGLKLSRAGETDTLIAMESASFIDGLRIFDPEAPMAVVTRLYQAALGRAVDQLAMNLGSTALQQGIASANAPVKTGLTTNQLAANIVASGDFVALHGANQSDTAFVSALYSTGLGRAADGGGLAFWTNFLAAGGSRGEVLAGFGQSAEMRTITAGLVSTGLWDVDERAAQVARLYLAALDRVPDLPGFIVNVNYLLSAPPIGSPGPTLQGLAGIILASPEFNRVPAGDDAAFVTRLYAQALDRAPEAAGLAFWTAALKAGTSRAEVLLGFSESAEHLAVSAPFVLPSDAQGIVFA